MLQDVAATRETVLAKSPMLTREYHLGRTPPNAGKKYPPEILTPAEILELIGLCSSRGPGGLRMRALIVALWRGGLRISEALALYPKDIDPANGTVRVLHSKSHRARTVGIDPQAMAVIQRWLDARAKLGIGSRSPVFCTISHDRWGPPGRPIRSAYVRLALKRLCKRSTITKRVHPHGFRHTHAFELAMEGTPMHIIKLQLGHKSLATTDEYLRHIAPVDVINVTRARIFPGQPTEQVGELVHAA